MMLRYFSVVAVNLPLERFSFLQLRYCISLNFRLLTGMGCHIPHRLLQSVGMVVEWSFLLFLGNCG